MTYASSLDVDPGTREIRLAGTTPAEGQPAVQIVLATLATQRGTYVPDPDEGVDYTIADKAVPNVGALWKAEIERALARHVRARVIRDLSVLVEVDRSTLRYAVSFVDPRDTRTPQRIKRSVTL